MRWLTPEGVLWDLQQWIRPGEDLGNGRESRRTEVAHHLAMGRQGTASEFREGSVGFRCVEANRDWH